MGCGRRRSRRPALIGLAVFVVISVAIGLLVGFLSRRSKHGQDEYYDDAQFRVDSFTLMGRNESSSIFAAEVRLTAQNPNKDTALSYDHVAAAVYFSSRWLARTDLPPFSLDEMSQAPMNASFAALAGIFFERDVASFDLRMDLTSEENEKEKRKRNKNKKKKKRKSWGRVRGKGRTSTDTQGVLHVFCGGLVVAKPINGMPGALTGGPRPCQVEGG